MPAAADITVKKANGSTDVVWSKLAASGGDSSPAVWSSLTSATYRNLRHSLTMTSRWNGNRSSRRVDVRVTFPYLDSDGVPQSATFEFTGPIPTKASDAEISEMVHQATNLLGSTLIRTAMVEGYSPT